MEMHHLRAFLAVAQTLHFGEAAKRLRVAQPAVSASIRALEEEIGAVLFDRTRRSVALSAAGVHLRPAVEEALASLERGVVSAQRAARGQTGRVVLQFTAMSALSPLPMALARFRSRFPSVQLIVEQRGTLEQLEGLRSGRCDLAFTVMPGEIGALASAPLTTEPLVVVLPSVHPLAGADAISFAEIAHEPMLILPRSMEPAVTEAYRQLCLGAGAPMNVAMEVDQLDAALAFVAAGLGVTLAPASVRRLRLDGVFAVRLVPEIPSGVTIVWSRDRLTPAAQALLTEVQRCAAEGAPVIGNLAAPPR